MATFFGASPSLSLDLLADFSSTFLSDVSEASFFSVEALAGASPSVVFDDDDVDDLEAGACWPGGRRPLKVQRSGERCGGMQTPRTSPSDLDSFFSSAFFSDASSLSLDEIDDDFAGA